MINPAQTRVSHSALAAPRPPGKTKKSRNFQAHKLPHLARSPQIGDNKSKAEEISKKTKLFNKCQESMQ